MNVQQPVITAPELVAQRHMRNAIIGKRCLGIWTAHELHTDEPLQRAPIVLQLEDGELAIYNDASRGTRLALNRFDLDLPITSAQSTYMYFFNPLIERPVVDEIFVCDDGFAFAHTDGYVAVLAGELRLAGVDEFDQWERIS